MLKKFKIDNTRDLLIPNFACYQMDLSGPVGRAIAAGEVDENFKTLPSWAKFVAHPNKSKGFFTRVLEGLFLGQGGHDELNVDLQVNSTALPHARVAMMFMPANTRNEALEIVGQIAKDTLPGYEVILLCGSVLYNGRKVNNRRAEQTVKEIIESGKSVLIIAAQMAQRSFSIPEITELYLAYDRGENGATIQKMSRTLTPGHIDKVGRIFSLSFDPNRDDKFDSMIVETALNYKKRTQGKSLQEAMRDVLRTVDIFRCSPDGAIKVEINDYLEVALSRKGISRVLGKIVNLNLLSHADIVALANGNSEYFRNQVQEVVLSGKTRDLKPAIKSSGKHADLSTEKELAKARETITNIVENLDVILYGTKCNNIVDALEEHKKSETSAKWISDQFGVGIELIYFLFKKEIIKQDWVELMYDNAYVS